MLLTWTTATELDNKGFEIQGSVDGESWVALAFVDGFGTTTETQYYGYTVAPLKGVQYFRLKQMDFGGTFAYSPVIQISIDESGLQQIEVYPNPVQDVLVIRKFNGTAFLHDVRGNLITKLTLDSGLNDHIQGVINFKEFPEGQYFLTIVDNAGRRFTRKIIK